MTSTDIYGYGDASNTYGYGDASPDTYNKLGYESTSCDADKYGCGSEKVESNPYGYGDSNPYDYGDSNPYGYGDDSSMALDAPPRRERPRRRCSVTKYSLEATEEVKESVENNEMMLTDEDPAPSSSRELSVDEEMLDKEMKDGSKKKKRWFSRKK